MIFQFVGKHSRTVRYITASLASLMLPIGAGGNISCVAPARGA